MATFNEKKTCSQRMENFGRFVWNPDTGELLGRTLVKWVYISLYYVAFYLVIIGLFALALYSLMKTLNPYTPDYQDRLHSPGVTLRPDNYGEEGIEICFNVSDPKTWAPYVSTLHNFLSAYNASLQNATNRNCEHMTGYYPKKTFSGPDDTACSCQFTREMLGNCSGLCDSNFGYDTGKPCLIIKMNRIINFCPGNETDPPYVDCTATENGELGEVEYFPSNRSFPLYYFPYYGKKAQPNYTNPLVAVKLLNTKNNTEISVVCKVVGKGISSDNPHDPYEGKVSFKLKIET
ncbi:potassium-transporting ATPase subunit beta [Microcaecilia unicolor]|uniref:Sodium/potassium-transporting ATPase subunit beta n=1 Tax=Microcaecilia unicolor TaxID=1415580 RepID=A0A6P7Y3D4_9AMPH|nr:potassium-transporting ATPase subunit beta [Microcaecilia unicolor]